MKANQSGNSTFGLRLFTGVAAKEKQNVLVSPFSAYVALSMALNGAAGKTREQMAQALGTSAGAVNELNERIHNVLASLNAKDKTVQLNVASAIYSDTKIPISQSFIENCHKIFFAEAHSVNFADQSTVSTINAWCDKKTNGKISTIIDRLTPDEKLVLLNAIYFKGAWDHQFTPIQTTDDKFTTRSGEKITVKMMRQTHDYLHYKGQNFSAIALPYTGEEQDMFIFLPDSGVDIAKFQSQFTTENWAKWMQSFQMADIRVSLPRFKMSFSTQLNEVLAAMGMNDAFVAGKADFSQMVKQPTWISRVLQKTYMDVNEEGTEAAAVTAVMMGSRAAMLRPEPVVEFRVDRPFVVAIVDKPSQEILFLGTITNPNAAK